MNANEQKRRERLFNREQHHGIKGARSKTYTGRIKAIGRKAVSGAGQGNQWRYDLTISHSIYIDHYSFTVDYDVDLRRYFMVGETVIHHAGYAIPEKKNNSGINTVCVDCGSIVNRQHVHCPHCGCVVL